MSSSDFLPLRTACASLLALILFVPAGGASEPVPEAKCALERLNRFAAGASQPAVAHKLIFVYFTPADREPPAGYRERLGRVIGDIQEFYAKELDHYGLGRKTIHFDLDAKGALAVHDVKGRLPAADYIGNNDFAKGDAIKRESRPVLTAAGIDDAKETVIYFCDLRTEQNGHVSGIGPYYGGGSFSGPFRSGHGWFTDATILDPDRLSDKTMMIDDEQYGHISVGRYNSIFIGGAAHELGHALGLPHDKEQRKDHDRGTSLMGSGNRTYGEERRGEGRGSFLTLADALRLASNPIISGTDRDLGVKPECRLEDLRAEVHGATLELSGRITATPEPYALIVYNDPFGGSEVDAKGWHDYNSTTWPAPLDTANRFTVRIGEFKPGPATLRVAVCHVNGTVSTVSYPLTAGDGGVPDATPLAVPFALHGALQAWSDGHLQEAAQLATQTEQAAGTPPIVREWAANLAAMSGPEPAWPAPASVPAETKSISLSRLAWEEAKVGWQSPARDHIPRAVAPAQPFLELAGQYYADGLYAHAPARYLFKLDGRWKGLTAEAGLQSGANGSAVFVVKADGREVFRSPRVTAGKPVHVAADITGAQALELLTEEAPDGNRGAWAIWCAPTLVKETGK